MSCLFASLGQLTSTDTDFLRQEICNYIAQNPELIEGVDSNHIIQWESGLQLDEYVSRMRHSHVWGGALELKAFVDMTGIPVHVVDVRTHPSHVIKFEPSESTLKEDCRLILNWSGSHYSPSGASRTCRLTRKACFSHCRH